ncbi:LysR family transcriptional regulator [Alkalilacustris brevis]|uniref:LysR family transcriptional regulator n=1 Tax=Alkalilacustris brevis TaxID=2026338 RepID=UPI000E0D2FEF|nr:LysR family transcriptional regulator [Alkalilacustris brevis]
MSVEAWDEIRTAFHVARIGTVSGAAEALGVHHATVIRHVDALEARLGVRLFQRHSRGYTPTEAGEDLLRVARATDEQFTQLANRIKGGGQMVNGEVTVTAVPQVAGFLSRSLAGFQRAHPDVTVRLLSDTRLLRLEYGEAHVAVRAGTHPQEPDNVVQPFGQVRYGLYAAQSYIEANGLPASENELAAHRLIGADDRDTRVPFLRWINEHVPPGAVTFRVNDVDAIREAVLAGAGLGFLPEAQAGRDDLVAVLPPREAWVVHYWLVTHVDLHRSAKVQAVLAHLKADAGRVLLG